MLGGRDSELLFVVVVMCSLILLGGIVVRRGWLEKMIGGTGG